MSSRVARSFVDRSPPGVGEVPDEVVLTRDVRARVAAAHRHDQVGALGELVCQALRPSSAMSTPELGHRRDHLGCM